MCEVSSKCVIGCLHLPLAGAVHESQELLEAPHLALEGPGVFPLIVQPSARGMLQCGGETFHSSNMAFGCQ